jgi:predicted Zn-dependent protease with MMP-like domain
VHRDIDYIMGVIMNRDTFQELVEKALQRLPEEFRSHLENVDVIIEDWPSPQQLANARLRHRASLLGLYEGVPVTERGQGYNLVLPDKITIFQKPVETICRSPEEVELEVERVLRHEIGHYFGLGEGQLRIIEKGWQKN